MISGLIKPENSVVYIYNTAGKLTGTLTGFEGPQGLAVDKTGNLYVADEGNNRIQVFAKGYKGRPTTLNDVGQYPIGVAVDGSGNVAVANYSNTSYQGLATIAFYANGSTSPTSIVTSQFLVNGYFDAFDAQGNLYLTGVGLEGEVVIGEIVGGIAGNTIASLQALGPAFLNPAGIEVTTKGLISLLDESGLSVRNFNPPNDDGELTPAATTPLPGTSAPVTFAFTPKNAFLVTADAVDATANVYTFPAGSPGGKIKLPLGSQPIGVALNPTQIP